MKPFEQFFSFSATFVLASALSACGGGGGASDEVTVEPNTRVLAKDFGNMGAVNEDGTVQVAQKNMTSGIDIDWDAEGNPITRNNATFSVRTTKDGAVMIVDGQEMVFTAADKYGDATRNFAYYRQAEDDENGNPETDIGWISAWDPDILEDSVGADNDNYAQIWQYYYLDAETSKAQRGFAVVGTQTDMTDVANDKMASYSGYTVFRIFPDENYDGHASETGIGGRLRMYANFSKKTVGGAATNLEIRPVGSESWDNISGGVVVFETATYDEHGEFTGELSLNDLVEESLEITDREYDGSYSGAFFGQSAKQVAGVTSFDSEGKPASYGYFTATKDGD